MNYFKKKLEQRRQRMEQQRGGEVQGALGGTVTGEGFSQAQATGGTGESFAEQRAGTEGMGQGFAERREAFSRTQQADDPNRLIMREDYGWKMTDKGYGVLEKDRKRFESELQTFKKNYNKRIAEARAKGQKEIAAERNRYSNLKKQFEQQYWKDAHNINKARMKLGAAPTKDRVFNEFWNKRKMRVTVWDGKREQGSYWIPREFVNPLSKKLEGSFTGKGTWRVNVRQGGRIRGQELHNMLRRDYNKDRVKQQFFKDPRYQGAYKHKLGQWDRAKRDLDKAKAAWQQTAARDRAASRSWDRSLRSP